MNAIYVNYAQLQWQEHMVQSLVWIQTGIWMSAGDDMEIFQNSSICIWTSFNAISEKYYYKNHNQKMCDNSDVL